MEPEPAPDTTLWGKFHGLNREYPALHHLLDTAAIAGQLWDRYLSPSQRAVIAEGLDMTETQARSTVMLWAGLHDIGKLTPGFQQIAAGPYGRLSERLRRDAGAAAAVGHATASMLCGLDVLADLGYCDGSATEPLRRAAKVLGGHHGRFPAPGADAQACVAPSAFGGPDWAAERLVHGRTVAALLGAPTPPEAVSVPAAVLACGLVILADWLASQEDFLISQDAVRAQDPAAHFGKACAAAPDVVARAGLVPARLTRKEFAEATGVGKPNPLQRSLLEQLPGCVAGPGILVVAAATGDGKTEAALAAEPVMSAAAGADGVCFLLPTAATSDQMHRRVSEWVAGQAPPGSASVTLTHSMGVLNAAYSDAALAGGPAVLSCAEEPGAAGVGSVLPGVWLRGWRRALLAQFSVGTVDQALLAVLPVRFSVLRMLALSGRTVVIDEAHAYDPYMQALLGRLLTWLGAFGTPVVLLSATLPGSVADRLVKAYLQGSMGERYRRSGVAGRSYAVPYPGWLFVDAAGGVRHVIDQVARAEQAAHRPVELAVRVRQVAYGVGDAAEGARAAGVPERLDVIVSELGPLSGQGGCALVVCATVDDAVATYAGLRDRLGLRPGELLLLHARMPAGDREACTARLVAALGRSGDRPGRLVVVATALVEQSLDLDADLVISDLGPLALLLQRAGRCWRHELFWASAGRPGGRERPAWCSGPALVVLEPVDGAGVTAVPDRWGRVYPEFALATTARLLGGRGGMPIAVPGQVQELVEQVHGAGAPGAGWADLAVAAAAMAGRAAAQSQAAQVVAVPPPRRVADLGELHRDRVGEARAATRLGADWARVLCCYRQRGGRLSLDASGKVPLPVLRGVPEAAAEDGAAVRAVMARTVPVPGYWVRGAAAEAGVPRSWRSHPLLSELVPLVLQPDGTGALGSRWVRLDAQLGLVRV